ncbi:hypothetical protein [Rhizobium sp. YTU87027]|uniref:hypothetical protein n=1 Tax=Rhizobium sp. YTU87027 TaxID=3417741 RepID=UPI003D6800BF
MKKPQRSFVVELKSGRRRQTSKPVSIWGSLDLKAVSAAVSAEAGNDKRSGLDDLSALTP